MVPQLLKNHRNGFKTHKIQHLINHDNQLGNLVIDDEIKANMDNKYLRGAKDWPEQEKIYDKSFHFYKYRFKT